MIYNKYIISGYKECFILGEKEMMDFINRINSVEKSLKKHSDQLKKLPQLSDGRISDEYKSTEFYVYHKKESDRLFFILQNLNSSLSNKQKRELSKYRRALKKQMRNKELENIS